MSFEFQVPGSRFKACQLETRNPELGTAKWPLIQRKSSIFIDLADLLH
jgi:DNA primase